jgi:antitoxin VapB
MAFSIKSDRADELARELAETTGESLTEAVTQALEFRLAFERRRHRDVAGRLRAVREEMRAVEVLDVRTDDEILGYDEHGMPS